MRVNGKVLCKVKKITQITECHFTLRVQAQPLKGGILIFETKTNKRIK